MSWIYDLPDGRKACICREGRKVLLHTFSGRGGGASAVLKEDCGSDPVCLMYYGTIYFAYLDTEKRIVFDGIGSGEEMRTETGGEAEVLRMACAAGRICIFYLTEDGDTGVSRLHMWVPYEDQICVIREESRRFQYLVRQINNTLLAVLYRGTDLIYAGLWKDGEFRNIRSDAEERLKKAEEMLVSLEQERESAGREKEKYKDALEREQKLGAEQSRKLREYEGMLRQREQEIVYAGEKYDELAAYASKLQNAVKQWREQYMEEMD